MPIDRGLASGLTGRATVTAPASPLPDNPVLPLVSASKAVASNGSMVTAAGFSDALDLAIEGVFSTPGTAPMTTPTIRVSGSGTNGSGAPIIDGAGVATNAGYATIAGLASPSGADGPPAEVLPGVSLIDTPGSTVVAAAPLAGAGGTIFTAKQVGGSFLADAPPGVSVAVAPLAGLPLANVAALLTTGIGGQVDVAFSAAGGGEVSPVGGLATTTAAVGGQVFLWTNGVEATLPSPLPAVAVAASGSFGLAPLFVKAMDASLRIAAGPTGAPGVAANSGYAAIVVEIGSGLLAPSGPSTATGHAGRVLTAGSTLALAGSGRTALVTDRDAHIRRSREVVDAVGTSLRRICDTARPFGPADLTPQQLGLIIDFTPFDRLAVEQTVDQLLEQLERLGTGLSSFRVSMDVAAELLALAVALSAWIIVPKILRRSPGAGGPPASDDATSFDGVSGLAGGTCPEES
jgi:hypothetical protein